MKKFSIVFLSFFVGCASTPEYYISRTPNPCVNAYLDQLNQCRHSDWLKARQCYQSIQRKCVSEEIFRNSKPGTWTKVE